MIMVNYYLSKLIMRERFCLQKKTIYLVLLIVFVVVGLIFLDKIKNQRVTSNTKAAVRTSIRRNINSNLKSYTFIELWNSYVVNSFKPTDKGYPYDFLNYCTPYPRGCGFDDKDPNFLTEFHGNFRGYYVVRKADKTWSYFEIMIPSPTKSK